MAAEYCSVNGRKSQINAYGGDCTNDSMYPDRLPQGPVLFTFVVHNALSII